MQKQILDILPVLKGAPLSILVVLSIMKRSVSVSCLCEKTGWSDKTVRAGLRLLEDRQMVAQDGYSRFMLAGDNLQLPLYWDEKILGPAYPESGNFPEDPGNFPGLESRVAALESEVERLRATIEVRKNSEVFGKFPKGSGKFPKYLEAGTGDGIRNYSEDIGEFPNEAGKIPELPEAGSGNIPEDPGNFPNESGEIPEAVNTHILNNLNNKVSKLADISTNLLKPDTEEEVNTLTVSGKIPEETGEFPNEAGKIPMAADLAWKSMLTQMEGKMDRATFKRILGTADLIGVAGGHYTVSMENKFLADWADKRLRDEMEKILSCMMTVPASISFVTNTVEWKEEHMDPAPTPDLLPVPENAAAAVLTEICNDYLADPIGIAYSMDELKQLIKRNPDPDILRFILPRAENFRAAMQWTYLDQKQAKQVLLTFHGITGAARAKISNMQDEDISLELIDYECQDQKLHPDPEKKEGLPIYKILNKQHVYQLPAEPLETAYLPFMKVEWRQGNLVSCGQL